MTPLQRIVKQSSNIAGSDGITEVNTLAKVTAVRDDGLGLGCGFNTFCDNGEV